MKLVFDPKTVDTRDSVRCFDLRKFQNALAKEFGETSYVGTGHATVVLEYSPELIAMLRPFPATEHLEFVVRQLACSDCKKKQMFICLDSQTEFLCDDCAVKRKKKGQK